MSIPITSPVDFISGPRMVSTPGNLLKGKTDSLQEMWVGITSVTRPRSLRLRPMITLVLGGKISPEQMVIRNQDFFTSFRIEAVVGEWVQQIDVENKQVFTDKGKSYSFDRLLIATGANPKSMVLKGSDLKNVFHLRSREHVENMVRALKSAKKVLVLGCGLVGLKAALELFHRGLEVTVAERLGRPLPVVVDDKAGPSSTSGWACPAIIGPHEPM